MVYHVVYKASKNYSNRSLIPLRLRIIGCRQTNKTFWEFDKEKIHKVLKILEKNQPLVMKRTKEVTKRSIAKGRIQDLGSLVVVSFGAPKGEKEKIRSFVRKAPCFQLCKRVYVFYQRHSQFDPKNELIDAQRLASFIRELGGEVKLLPKIVIPDDRSAQLLVDETRRQVEREIFDIGQKCTQLCDRQLKSECNHRQLSDSLRKIARRFITVKRKARYYEKWMGLDFSKSLMKTYRTLNKVRQASLRKNSETYKFH